jgi:protein TonB
MPAYAGVRPRERIIALAAVALVQLALGIALISGLRVELTSGGASISRLIEVEIPKRPRPILSPAKPRKTNNSAAAKTELKPIGGSPGPRPSPVSRAPAPVVAVQPATPAAGGGNGTGPAAGSGTGGGPGGQGFGEDEGGTDLVQIAGAIMSSDYPADLRERRIGGRVGILFTVGTNGRVTNCTVTRSSGVPELDSLTCRLIQQRFRYRPSTDRYGRPIADEVDGEHDWVASGG